MVTSGTHVNSGCCFDYGNTETDHQADGNGAMDAINFGTVCWFGGCSGTGPWVQADLENGLFAGGGNGVEPQDLREHQPVRHRDAQEQRHHPMALKGANAQSGSLTSSTAAHCPPRAGTTRCTRRAPSSSEVGGDNRNDTAGTFYEGVMIKGYPSDATDTAVQANIVAAGYAPASGGTERPGQSSPALTAPSAWTTTTAAGRPATRYRCGTVTASRPLRAGPSTAAAPSPSPAAAWTSPAPTPPTAPCRIVDLQRRREPAVAGEQRGAGQPRHREMPRRPRLQYHQRNTARHLDL